MRAALSVLHKEHEFLCKFLGRTSGSDANRLPMAVVVKAGSADDAILALYGCYVQITGLSVFGRFDFLPYAHKRTLMARYSDAGVDDGWWYALADRDGSVERVDGRAEPLLGPELNAYTERP